MLKIIKCTKSRGAFLDSFWGFVVWVWFVGFWLFFFFWQIEFTWTLKENKIGHTMIFQKRYFVTAVLAVCAHVHTTILTWSKFSGLSANSCSFTSLLSVHKYSYLPQIIYLYHSNFLSSLNFLILAANFLAQENSLLSCIVFLYIKVTTFLQL